MLILLIKLHCNIIYIYIYIIYIYIYIATMLKIAEILMFKGGFRALTKMKKWGAIIKWDGPELAFIMPSSI